MIPVRCAAIIAGGASRRMGQNKALIPINGEPLVTRVAKVLRPLFSKVVVVTFDFDIARAAALPAIEDEVSGRGPLGGIHAALRHFNAPVFCVACDMPFLNGPAIEFLCAQLKDFDAVLPRLENGEASRAEPLHAVYAPSCLPFLEAEFACERVRPVEGVLENARLRFVEEDQLRVFDGELRFLRNWNYPHDACADGFAIS